MCKDVYHCAPDDERIASLDPIIKRWMFENWVADQFDNVELAKNHAYLLGSFWNPEAVKKLMGESGTTHASSDEEMLKSMEMVRAGDVGNGPKEEEKKGPKRKKKRTMKE